VVDGVAAPAEIRGEVRGLLEREGLGAAVERLRGLNPAGLGGLDVANPRRVARALERCLASGRSLVEMAGEFARQEGPFAGWDVRLTVLDPPREVLEQRIVARARAMLDGGLVEEVLRLRAAGFERNASAAGAIGYRETLAMLDGELAQGELEGAIVRNTLRLAKKQRTWLRGLAPAPGAWGYGQK
jgi:tRNA dimethylallyltransferase